MTVISAVPVNPGRAYAVIELELFTQKARAGEPPKFSPVARSRFVPVTVKAVNPYVASIVVAIPVTVGVGFTKRN